MSRAAAESYVSTFESGLGLLALGVSSALADGRAASARRIANQARCEAAAAVATGEVLQESAAELRERLADARAEADALREQLRATRADLAEVTAYAAKLRSQRLTIAA
ncbi:hypothetical protein [Roseomonas sp. BN140053]|uniref:hypothetical protein n=1 Tax=Roseomonas sp. BN140053 TaxID=3391898 RepID=UPI0039ED9579